MNIKYINFGTGNTIGQTVYLNKLLKNHPKLHDKILIHEINHISGNHKVDKESKFDPELFWFMIKHATTWFQFLPLWFIDNKIAYNKRSIAICCMFLLGLLMGAAFHG